MKKSKLALAALLLTIGAAALVFAAGVSARTHGNTATFKAAWIYVGPHNDGGWSQAHDQGRLYVQKGLGSKVITTYKESVPEGPQTMQVIESLIRDGNKIIFATSFGFQPAVVAEAKKHPDVYFEMATGTATSKNMTEYYGAGEDGIYLAGMAAGAAAKCNTLGYVATFPIPEVIRDTSAWTLGARTTHPGATVRVIWTNTWFDPAKEKKAAESLKAAGACVLGQNVDGPTTGQYAESQGIPWTGYDSDARKFAPKVWLTASTYNWGPYYLKRVKAAMDGSWKSGFYYGGLKDGFVKLAPFGPKVTAATRKAIIRKRAQMVLGKFYEFTGPLKDQSGKVRVPAGKKMSVKDLYSMDWLVQGVVGSAKG